MDLLRRAIFTVKKLRERIIGLALIAMLMVISMPTRVSALSYDLNDGDIINSYNITSDVVTLYVGNISVDGTSTLKYLYTDKSVNTETLTEMRKILTSDYASLLPTTAGQVAVSSDSSVTVNDVFTDAGMVAINKYPSGTVSDTSSTILYNQTQYNSLATASQAEISDEATAETNNLSAWNTRKSEWDAAEQAKVDKNPEYTPVSFPEEYVKAFNDTTTYPTTSYFIADNKGTKSRGYIIRNGVVATVDTYPVNRTIIKVVNTSANVVVPQKINSLNIKIDNPIIGDTATSTTKPNVTIDSNAGYKLDFTQYLTKPETEGGIHFDGAFEEGKDYWVEVSLEADESHTFASSDDMVLKVNGKTTDYTINTSPDGSRWFLFYAKVSAAYPTYEYIDNTANQTYTINKDEALSFRINADYSLFENGGKVYVDDTLVSSDNYTSKSGSTIIELNKSFVDSLSVGEHLLKVVFNNGGEAATKFTIAKVTENTSTEEKTPTETITTPETPAETTPAIVVTTDTAKTTEAAKTTTTTAASPKTGDNMPIIMISLIMFASMSGIILIKKKNKM